MKACEQSTTGCARPAKCFSNIANPCRRSCTPRNCPTSAGEASATCRYTFSIPTTAGFCSSPVKNRASAPIGPIIQTSPPCARVFAQTDAMVEGFLSEFANSLDKPFTCPHPSFPDGLTVTSRWLFTHTVTHEFHHKGQITDICRHLGHPTPDTDLIIPENF